MLKTDMEKYNALSFDYNFYDYFYSLKDEDDFGIVHSIFDKAINIYNGEKIISLVNKEIGNGPYTLRVNIPKHLSFLDMQIKKEELVKKSEDKLLFNGGLNIIISSADLWNYNKKLINKLNSENVIKNLCVLKDILINNEPTGGCKYFLLKGDIKIFPNFIELELSKNIEKFIKDIDEDKEVDLKSLIGLGMGLTPSGDDFLTGFIITFSRIEKASSIYQKIIINMNNIDFSTTDISINMLNSVLNGEVREEVLNFIYGFDEGDVNKFKEKLYSLLKIGSSSGIDLAVGIASAYNYIIQN